DNSTTSYFIYKGQPMGYEYELLALLAEHIGVDLEMVVVKNMDEIIDMLDEGYGDIIAANLTVTTARAQRIAFTEYNLMTRQILIQRKPDGWDLGMSEKELERALLRNPIDLKDKRIHVRKNSSFYTRLISLGDEIGGEIDIMEAPGDFDTELLISLVAQGDIKYTVADENVALVNQLYHPNIDIKTAISFPQQIAWAVNKSSPTLLYEINKWLVSMRGSKRYNQIYNKYFKNHKGQKSRVESEYFVLSGGSISKYDHIFKTYSKNVDWDWRLLASLAYQESNFNPKAVSWAGAFGLMQLMPATASAYGVDSLSTVAQNVKASTKYLAWLNKYWEGRIDDDHERIKFVLASYNAGLGHVIDARALAAKYGKSTYKWENNVDYYLLQKSKEQFYNDEVVKYGYCRGQETFDYVKEILVRYNHYKNVAIEV
ncbi:MAG: transporter substrate-binding domain-containing protein, partial [Flavobacteriales bacterium]|nr:transporter substrate-binding domain-containing protein [Flavobacteriales bacterium]